MERRVMDRRQDPHEDEEPEQPEFVPSFLTARELQAPEAARQPQDGEKPVGERRVLKDRRRSPG